MPPTNDFLPFCPTDTGTNLISQGAYVASAARPIGNQPGIASSQLNNKALRQATYVVSQLAQYISNQANVSTLDNATPAQLLSQMTAAFVPLSPVLTSLLSGTSTWHPTFVFFIASANATAGATYTNNSITYTVGTTISGGAILTTNGSGAPTTGGGVLTKASGTGDSTITFYAFRTSLYLRLKMVGGGGGGGGGDTGSAGGGTGGTGTNTTFGSQLVADGGIGGAAINPGTPGGATTLGSITVGIAIQGSAGGVGSNYNTQPTYAGSGGSSAFGGAGAGGGSGGGGADGAPNSGGGGGGGSAPNAGVSEAGGGGASGGYIETIIPSQSYIYTIGTGGSPGAGAGSGTSGGSGGSGLTLIEEVFQ